MFRSAYSAKNRLMFLSRPLSSWLLATVILFAATFYAGAGWAHGGRANDPVGHAATHVASTNQQATEISAQIEAPAPAADHGAVPGQPCKSDCCVGAAGSCCGQAMAVCDWQAGWISSPGRILLTADELTPRTRSPGRLSEPPIFFA